MMNRASRLKIAATAVAGALALIAAAPASAYVIGFETNGLPVFGGTDTFSEADYNMTVLDSPAGFQGAAGRITDGSDQHACDVMQCPSGNSSYYFMGLNDGGLVVQRGVTQSFQLKSLDYTFVAPIGGLQDFNYGQLRLTGQLAGGGKIETQFDFPSQDADGVYTFGHSALAPAFSHATLTSLTISACLFGSDNVCYNPAANQAQFGIDNLNVNAVPEPETYAMLLAGLAAMGVLSRRRTPSAAPKNNA